MTLTVGDILARIDAGAEIPTILPVMRRLWAVKEGEDDYNQLLELAQNDAAIAVRVLRAANASGDYGEESRDIPSAFSKLGVQAVRRLALTTKFLDDQQSTGNKDPNTRLQWLWERSLCASVAAETFAQRMGIGEKVQYRLLGLLLDVGAVFMATVFPERYLPILDRWREEGGPLEDIEEEELGVNHRTVGRQLAHAWTLGQHVELSIGGHICEQAVANVKINCDVLTLANISAGVFFEERHITGLERAIRFAGEKLNIAREEFIDILQRITLVSDAAATKVNLEAGPSISYVELLRNVNAELGRATLSYEQMVRELETAMHQAETLALKLEEANRKLREAANIDPLTKVHNRRYFEEFLAWNFNRAQRYDSTLGCMMIDIDHFKAVNDTHGHLMGDHVLQGVAQTLRDNLRNTDIVARYGGEEFIVLLPETRADSVQRTALKLNKAVKAVIYPLAEGSLQVSVSVGYVAFTPSEMPNITSPTDLIRLADQNMYQAKLNGRDKIWPEQ